jgi:hypothetical protein
MGPAAQWQPGWGERWVTERSVPDITALLTAWRRGDQAALD